MTERLTRETLLAELRRLLARPDTTVVSRRMNRRRSAEVEWEHGSFRNIAITLDPRRDGRARCVIHELLHVYFSETMKIDAVLGESLEEAAILAWEAELAAFLERNNARELDRWDRAIQRKIAS